MDQLKHSNNIVLATSSKEECKVINAVAQCVFLKIEFFKGLAADQTGQ